MPQTECAQRAQDSHLRDNLRPFLSNADAAQTILRQIESEGYVILPGTFSQHEVDHEYKRMWDWVQTVVPSIRKDNPATWRARGRIDPWPCSQRDMMQLHQAGWLFGDLREAMAERVFEKIYGTSRLHCSKDGFTLQRPSEEELARTPNDHYDQGFARRGLQCIQGSIALTDQEYDDGCFLCWPGSHRVHDEMMDWRGCGSSREDFIILNRQEHEWLRAQGFEPKRVPVKRGDVILWRSDLVHKGAPPIGRRENFRAVVYVCMLPASMTPEAVYKDKMAAYKQLKTGCHWPNREEWFRPRRHSAELQPYFRKPPLLSLRQQQLYGLVRYTTSTPEILSATSAYAGTKEDKLKATSPDIAATDDSGRTAAGKAPRRWGRGSALSGVPPATAQQASQATTLSCEEDRGPCRDDDAQSASELRRLQKALKEIAALEVRRDNGERLRKNQMQKIARKDMHLHDLECLAPKPTAQGGT